MNQRAPYTESALRLIRDLEHRTPRGMLIYVPRDVRSAKTMDAIEELDALQIAKALGDHTRFLIYKHLTEAGEMRCGDICLDTRVRAPTVSHHLRVLSEAGLVHSRRDGQAVYYRVVSLRLRAYVRYLQRLDRSLQRPSEYPAI